MESIKGSSDLSISKTDKYVRGTNYFLGIAIDEYVKYNHLRNCVNDVTVMRDTLINQYDFDIENTEVLINHNAGRKEILKTVQNTLGKVGENDSLILMYSGHGDRADA